MRKIHLDQPQHAYQRRPVYKVLPWKKLFTPTFLKSISGLHSLHVIYEDIWDATGKFWDSRFGSEDNQLANMGMLDLKRVTCVIASSRNMDGLAKRRMVAEKVRSILLAPTDAKVLDGKAAVKSWDEKVDGHDKQVKK